MVPKIHILRPFATPRATSNPAVSVYKRALFTSPARKYYHSSPPWQQDVSAQTSQHRPGNPVAESMRASTTPTGNVAAATPRQDDPNRNAAFLGEADSDDGFEVDVEANPEAHRHRFDDVSASGLHGQSGEGDNPFTAPRPPHTPLDGTHSAYLGEADSNDALEADRAAHPEKYLHRISDASHAAFLGEADSDLADDADRAARPEVYAHRIGDVGVSGLHGGPGEGDENIPRGEGGRRFV